MTSFASSIPEGHLISTSNAKQGPFELCCADDAIVVFLTHRRGGAVCLVKPNELRVGTLQLAELPDRSAEILTMALAREFCSKASSETLQCLSSIVRSLLVVHDAVIAAYATGERAFVCVKLPGIVAAIGATTTAEHLTLMYQRCLAEAAISDLHVAHVVMGIGPGSFTGLRLGCAFANGLALGRERVLWNLPCAQAAVLEKCFAEANFEAPFFLPSQGLPQRTLSSALTQGDESSLLVSSVDLMAAWAAVLGMGPGVEKSAEGAFVPQYGKEPSPVIKLREKNMTSPQ